MISLTQEEYTINENEKIIKTKTQTRRNKHKQDTGK